METNHGILYINFNRDKLLIIPFYQILLFFSSEETVENKALLKAIDLEKCHPRLFGE